MVCCVSCHMCRVAPFVARGLGEDVYTVLQCEGEGTAQADGLHRVKVWLIHQPQGFLRVYRERYSRPVVSLR